jgi:hypothetical protein
VRQLFSTLWTSPASIGITLVRDNNLRTRSTTCGRRMLLARPACQSPTAERFRTPRTCSAGTAHACPPSSTSCEGQHQKQVREQAQRAYRPQRPGPGLVPIPERSRYPASIRSCLRSSHRQHRGQSDPSRADTSSRYPCEWRSRPWQARVSSPCCRSRPPGTRDRPGSPQIRPPVGPGLATSGKSRQIGRPGRN